MKSTYNKILAGSFLLTAAIAMTSCDYVASDERYIPGDPIVAERAVLLEDFTGQMCVNCPDAHTVIEQLEEQYGKDKVIAVSIHCGDFGISTERTNFEKNNVGLMTAEGNAILQTYSISSFPMGVINMGQPEIYDLWPTSVRNGLQKATDVTIDLEVEYIADEKDGENGYYGTINVKADVLSSSDHAGNIQFWILENDIVAMQRTQTTTIPDYVHQNVFRAQVFSGVRGQDLYLKADMGQTIEGSIATRWTDKERWEIKNLSVVAIVSDKSGVLQVKRIPLFKTEGDDEDTETEE